jgi:ABC-2 type transport system ATP-binding protein
LIHDGHRPAGATAPADPPVIELDGLSVRLGGRPVLQDLRGALTGRAIGLLGPNGAGKTTLIHTLLGFYGTSGGHARILGHDVVKDHVAVKAMTGYMPEGDSYIADMTGVRFVRLLAELSGLPAAAALERTHEAMFYVGLGEARYRKLGSYSTGMKQLAKLAQALVHGPRLLFLDEPTNGLDPPARARMLKLVEDIRDSGRARVVLSSHLLKDVEQVCDEVLILKDGKIARHADLAAERRDERRLLDLEVQGREEGFLPGFIEGAEALGVEVAVGGRRGVNGLKMVLPPEVSVADLYHLADQRRVEIRRLTPKRDSLEDIFLQAMGIIEGGPATGAETEGGQSVGRL